MADLWAGAEVQLAILLRSLARHEDREVAAILLNAGRLAHDLQGAGIRTTVILEGELNPLPIMSNLSDYLRRNKIEVLHTHKYKDNTLSALAAVCHATPYR